MRFILGLIFGASLTLLAVTAYTGEFPLDVKKDALKEAQSSLQMWLKENQPAAAEPTPMPPSAAAPQPIPAVVERVEPQAPVEQPKPLAKPEVVVDMTPTPHPDTAPAGGRQAVWTPFHSEASAKGFAGRLSAVIGHPFQVERLAAQTYVVTFDYRSEPEREALESRVLALTGGDAT